MRLACLLIILGALTVTPSTVEARTRDVTVTKKLDTIEVAMAPGRPIVLMFKSDLLEWVPDTGWRVQVAAKQKLSSVELYAPKGTSAKQIEGTLIVATRAYTLYIHVKAASPGTAEADDAINIEHTDLVSLCDAHDQREIDERVASAVAERDAQHRDEIVAMEAESAAKEAKHQRELVERYIEQDKIRDRHLLGQVSARLVERPLQPIPCERQGQGLMMCSVRLMFMGQSGLLRLTVNNRSTYDAPVGRAQVYSGSTGDDLATSTHIAVTSQGDADKDPEQGVIGVIPRGGSAILSIKLRDPDRLGQSFKIVLSGNVSVFPAMQPVHLMDRVQLEAEERERQRIRAREAERVSLHVTGSYGALFVAPDVDGAGTEVAGLTGLGVRFTKGLFPRLALETEIGGASSGVATFGGVTIGGTVGELTRSARLARVTVGGALRFGDTVMPNVRAGIGVQVADNDETFMSGAGPVEGPGDGLEVGMAAYVGGGIDVKLGSNLIAGVGTSFTMIQRGTSILDLGLNLAYRWDAHE